MSSNAPLACRAPDCRAGTGATAREAGSGNPELSGSDDGRSARVSQAGIQVIIYGQQNRDDIGAVLRDVGQAGFAGAEVGNLFRLEGDEGMVHRFFQETGLKLCGCHAGFGEFEDGSKLTENIRFTRALDSRYLMCSGVGDRKRGLAAYRVASRLFYVVGRRCRDEGAVFCYHIHAWEFEDREGDTCGMDVLAAETDPALVKFCLDVYW